MRTFTGLLAVGVILAVTMWSWHYGRAYPGADFFTHWAVVNVLPHDGVPSLYSEVGMSYIVLHATSAAYDSGSTQLAQVQRPAFLTPATPFLHTVLLPIHTGDYDHDYATFRVLTLLATILAVVGLGVWSGLSLWHTALLYTSTTIFFDPFLSTLRAANVSQLQLGAFSLYLMLAAARGHTVIYRVLAGVLLGALVTFKPNTALIIPSVFLMYLLRHQRLEAVCCLLGVTFGVTLAATLSSIAYGSPDCWRQWVEYLSRFTDIPPSLNSGNYAIFGLVPSLAKVPHASPLLSTALFTTYVLVAMRARTALRSLAEKDALLWAASMALTITLLSAPLAWVHYFNFVLPLIVLLVGPVSYERTKLLPISAIGGILLIAGRPLAMSLPVWGPERAAAFTLLGVALLFVAGCAFLNSRNYRPAR